MSAPKDGGPAFPVSTGHHPDTMMKDPRIGMTLRDYFAAAALTGLLADRQYKESALDYGNGHGMKLTETICRSALEYADAMLAERGRQ